MQAAAAAEQACSAQLHPHRLAALAAVVQVVPTLEPLPELLGCQTLAAAQVAAGKMAEPQEYPGGLAS
jgi:hypothetical protein